MNGTRFSFVKYDAHSITTHENLKKRFEDIEDVLAAGLPASRERSLCITHLEEAFMWAGKAIRDEQISRNPETKHVPERGNS